jgi:hypothetical protein
MSANAMHKNDAVAKSVSDLYNDKQKTTILTQRLGQ